MKKTLFTIAAITCLSATTANAAEQIRIVGSSTVFPFSSYVAEEFGATTKFKTPVIESTGSGGGMKLFCAGNDENTPDVSNASRRIKKTEFALCAKNGVNDIHEVVFGFDGIAIAQSAGNKAINLSRKDLLLAVAQQVPNKEGTALIDNPYKFWDEVNATLPHRPILFYGPPTSSGTRDAFEELVMQKLTKKMPLYKAVTKKYSVIRQDGLYVPSGENDNLIVQKLTKDTNSFGIFGYSFLEENEGDISGATIDGISPTPDTISSGEYPVSRSLFFYVKGSHLKTVPSLNDYVNLFLNEKMIGEEGFLSEIGLIPLPTQQRELIRNTWKKGTTLTADQL
ncbi:MAG: PstS family phosphate ABC transporter substrate-binding protein [Mariprofundaceae bacterium]|nr:PstS family phosphate ABC transporter substrate-binding protein [Mariprofundaceae bacterium]